jgi:hypothetical protein
MQAPASALADAHANALGTPLRSISAPASAVPAPSPVTIAVATR